MSVASLVRGIIAALMCGLLAIVQSAGFGLLLLSGEAQSLVPAAVGMALFSTAVMAAVATMTSSIPGVIAIAQGIPIAALAGPIAAITATIGVGAASKDTIATVVAAVALTTGGIGATAYLLGVFGLGRFVRFVPFPVIGGFLAGSGWLILLGGIGVVAGHSVELANLDLLVEPSALMRFGTAAMFLLPVALLQARLPVGLILPTVALATIVIFNLVTFFGGIGTEILRAEGWLIAVAHGDALWPPIGPSDVALIDWRVIAGQALNLPAVVILSVVAVLMNATGIELDTRRDVDLDRELRSVGLQNLLGGTGGGMPGFHSVSLTALTARLGTTNALAGTVVSALCIAALVFGDTVLAFVPTPLLGGLLIWIGLTLLIEWLVLSNARLSQWEYLVIVLIFAVIVLVSFVAGILVGLIAASVLFVIEYGQVEIVRHVMTGKDYQSSNDISEDRREVLRSAGDAILIVRLQGYPFFGTADRLRKRIQQRIEDHHGAAVRYVIVDFQRVSGLDSSTVVSFTRLTQATGPAGLALVLCGMSAAVRTTLERGGIKHDDGEHVRFEDDLDHGLEWCENELLTQVAPQVIANASVPVDDLLTGVVKDRELAESLVPFLDRFDVIVGEKLIEQGKPSDDIYFLEQGRAAVVIEADGEHLVRVATVGRGSIVGEMSFYLDRPRSASVVAETPVVAWRLSAKSLERLCAISPKAAVAFHRGMAGMIADRLSSTNQLVRLLAD